MSFATASQKESLRIDLQCLRRQLRASWRHGQMMLGNGVGGQGQSSGHHGGRGPGSSLFPRTSRCYLSRTGT